MKMGKEHVWSLADSERGRSRWGLSQADEPRVSAGAAAPDSDPRGNAPRAEAIKHVVQEDTTTVLGFWTYLMTDAVLFASLFATYAVLRGSTYGGAGTEIFDAPFVLVETLLLLFSSFTCGLALLSARVQDKRRTRRWLTITGVLGALFVALEVYEFAKLIAEGHGPQASAFLSSYFTLVGTHGLHVTAGLLWLAALALAIARKGLNRFNQRKLVLFAIFWHFLGLIWIFIFTIVYMMGIL